MRVLLLNASAKNDGATQEILLTIKKFVPNAQDANVICLGDINPYPNHRVLSTRKKCYAIALRTGSTPSECENIIRSIRHWCGHMKIDMLDSILLCGIRGKDDIGHYKENICEKAQEWLAN